MCPPTSINSARQYEQNPLSLGTQLLYDCMPCLIEADWGMKPGVVEGAAKLNPFPHTTSKLPNGTLVRSSKTLTNKINPTSKDSPVNSHNTSFS